MTAKTGYYGPADRIRPWMHEPNCMMRSSVAGYQSCTCRLTILNSLALLTDSDLSEPLAIFTEVVAQQLAQHSEDFHRLIECGFMLEVGTVSNSSPVRSELVAICQRCHGEKALFFPLGTSLLELVQTAITHTKDVHRG